MTTTGTRERLGCRHRCVTRSMTMARWDLHHVARGLLFASLICLVVLPSFAQKDTGSIVGTVRDSSGAVLPGVAVTVTDLEHGTTYASTTNGEGAFVASPLRIGRYTGLPPG